MRTRVAGRGALVLLLVLLGLVASLATWRWASGAGVDSQGGAEPSGPVGPLDRPEAKSDPASAGTGGDLQAPETGGGRLSASALETLARPPEGASTVFEPRFRARRVAGAEQGVAVEGRVRFPDGAPAPELTVWLSSTGEFLGGEATTDADGRFRFGGVPIGRARVELDPDALPPGWVAPLSGGTRGFAITVPGEPLELVLVSGVRGVGRVVLVPAAEADLGSGGDTGFGTVVARSTTRGVHHRVEAEVGPDGFFEFDQLHRARYSFRLRPAARTGVGWGAPPARQLDLLASGGGELAYDVGELVVGLQSGGVQGRLVEAATEAEGVLPEPAGDALLLCFAADRHGNCLVEEPVATCRTDAEGAFRLEGLAGGAYCLRRAKTHGGSVHRFELGPGQRRALGDVALRAR